MTHPPTLRSAGPDCGPSPMPGNAPNLGKTLGDTTKCKTAARDVNGAASNLFKAIFQFIEVESIRKKKQKQKKSQVKRRTRQKKTRQDNKRARCAAALRAVLVASETRARVTRTKRHLTCGPQRNSYRYRSADQPPLSPQPSVDPTPAPALRPGSESDSGAGAWACPHHRFQFKLNKLPVCLHSPKYLKSKSRFLILLYTRITWPHPKHSSSSRDAPSTSTSCSSFASPQRPEQASVCSVARLVVCLVSFIALNTLSL